MAYSIIRRTSKPAVEDVVPKALYFIRAVQGGPVAIFMSDADGALHPCFDDAKVAAAIAQGTQSFGEMLVVANVDERDSLGLTHNAVVFVQNATGDPAISSGGAFYFFMKSAGVFVLLTKADSLHPLWSDITGRPTSSAAAIDAAVNKSHTHANVTVLDGLNDQAGKLYYKGSALKTVSFGQAPEW